jgi:hypothetical protein
MFLVKQKKIELVQLESLLNALVSETDNLTESQIEDVVGIQDSIKLSNKIVLSEEASVKYQEFIEKVMLFDDSLQESMVGHYFTGIDEKAYSELESKLLIDLSKDPALKLEIISKIDRLITDSDKTLGFDTYEQFVMSSGLSAGLSFGGVKAILMMSGMGTIGKLASITIGMGINAIVGGILLLLVRALFRLYYKKDRAVFKEKLMDLRNKIKNSK